MAQYLVEPPAAVRILFKWCGMLSVSSLICCGIMWSQFFDRAALSSCMFWGQGHPISIQSGCNSNFRAGNGIYSTMFCCVIYSSHDSCCVCMGIVIQIQISTKCLLAKWNLNRVQNVTAILHCYQSVFHNVELCFAMMDSCPNYHVPNAISVNLANVLLNVVMPDKMPHTQTSVKKMDVE